MQRYAKSVIGKRLPEIFVNPEIGLSGRALDTLEITSDSGLESLDFTGKDGLASRPNLTMRNRSKFLTNRLVFHLMQLKSYNEEKYRDTYYCSNTILVDKGVAKSKFCKRRWCTICNRIRTADLIQKYMPTVESWEQKQFVTLTVKNMPVDELGISLSKMQQDFVKIKDNLRKNYGTKLIGIRKLEITYNRFSNEYHPHFHLITSKDHSDFVINKWLEHNPTAERVGQDARKADKNSCFELFKYFTKLTSNSSKDKSITAEALDNIFQSIDGRRTFQTFGFVPHKIMTPAEYIESGAEQMLDLEEFVWNNKIHNWISKEGEIISDFEVRDLATSSKIHTWIS
jgi:hypothetical protein